MGYLCSVPVPAPRLILAILLVLAIAAPARSQQSAMNFFVDGVEAYESAHYEEAVYAFQKAIELEPDNLEYRYYLGLTYSAQKKPREALDVFEALVEKDPKNYLKALFDIAAVYSSQGMHDKAVEALSRADAVAPDSARVHQEMGYAYKNMQKYDQALRHFQKAKDLDPDLTQVSDYDMAAVYLDMERFDQAEAFFRKAAEIKPDSAVGKNAMDAIPQVRAIKRARKPWYLATSLGWAYDDNVALDPLEGVGQRTGLLRDSADQFQTFMLRGGYKLVNRKDLEVAAGYMLNTIGYQEFVENNVLGHIPHLYVQYQKNPILFRFTYDFSYYYAGGTDNGQDKGFYLTFGDSSEGKLRMHGFLPTLTIFEPHNLKTDLSASYQKKEYLDGVTPDADHYFTEIIQSYRFPNREWYPRIGYRYDHEDSVDDASSYASHEAMAGFSMALPWGAFGDVSLRYARTSYEAFPVEGKRRDRHYLFSISLTRTFYERFMLQLMYNHDRNDTNVDADGIDPFKYKKNVYIASLTVMF